MAGLHKELFRRRDPGDRDVGALMKRFTDLQEQVYLQHQRSRLREDESHEEHEGIARRGAA